MRIFRMQVKTLLRAEFRRWSNLVFFLVLTLFSIWIFVPNYIEGDALGMIQYTQYAQMTAMLYFLFMGAKLANLERKVDCYDTVFCYETIPLRLVASKLAVLTLISILYTLLISSAMSVFYFLLQMPGSVFLYGYRMILLYFLFPAMICSTLGMILGSLIAGRSVYLFLAIIWAFISPISAEVSAAVFEMLDTKSPLLRYLFGSINLGGRISIGTVPLYGLPFEPAILYLDFIKLGGCLALLFVLPLLKQRYQQRILSVGVVAVSVLICVIAYNPVLYCYFVFYNTPSVIAGSYDEYWRQYSLEQDGRLLTETQPQFSKQDSLTVQAHDIVLDVGPIQIRIVDHMKVTPYRSEVRQTFTLYHNFQIDRIEYDGQLVDYRREGDYIELDLSGVRTDQTAELTIAYHGISSPLFPATRGSVLLPAGFPWLPQLGYKEPLKTKGYNTLFEFILYDTVQTDPIPYTIRHDLPADRTYSNISLEEGRSVYTGISDCGVSLFYSPLLTQQTTAETTCYYPANLDPWVEELNRYQKKVVQTQNTLLETLDAGTRIVNDAVMYLPYNPIFSIYADLAVYPMNGCNYIYFVSPSYAISAARNGWSEDSQYIRTQALRGAFASPTFLRQMVEQPINAFLKECMETWWLGNREVTDFARATEELYAQESYFRYQQYTDPAEINAVKEIAVILDQFHNSGDGSSALTELYSQWYQMLERNESPGPLEILRALTH